MNRCERERKIKGKERKSKRGGGRRKIKGDIKRGQRKREREREREEEEEETRSGV